MDVDENDKQTHETNPESSDTQIITDESSSAIPKVTTINADQNSKKLSSSEINEKDIKTAAASALAAAAVKAKVNLICSCILKYVSLIFLSLLVFSFH